jgi:hypothetical protein
LTIELKGVVYVENLLQPVANVKIIEKYGVDWAERTVK